MIFCIRNCSATGQEPDAPLTEAVRGQAHHPAVVLMQFGITRILSSPNVRALQSIGPFAVQAGIRLEIDEPPRECIAATEPVLAASGDMGFGADTAVASHDRLTRLLLRALGFPVDCDPAMRMTNPDVFRIMRHACRHTIMRLWK